MNGDKYQLAYLDPAWRYKNWSMTEMAKYDERWCRRNGRSPYPVMTTEDISKMPVPDLLDPKCSTILMWATVPKMEDAFWLLNYWGYEHKTHAFHWFKLNPSGIGWHYGMGFYTHQNPEYVLLGTPKKGKGLSRVAKDVFSVVVHPRGEHSAKPSQVRRRIERLFGPVRRIELFAREAAPGWDAYGNEVICTNPWVEELFADFYLPPYQAIIDEDEYEGLPVIDTVQESYDHGEQIRLM